MGSGAYGGIKEAAEQIAGGDMSIKDLLMSVITSPVTVIKDARDFMQKDKRDMAMGGMAEMRKKGMGLKSFKGGGAVKKRAVKKRAVKRKSKAKGMGAAVRGTKFKGVF